MFGNTIDAAISGVTKAITKLENIAGKANAKIEANDVQIKALSEDSKAQSKTAVRASELADRFTALVQ